MRRFKSMWNLFPLIFRAEKGKKETLFIQEKKNN